MNLQRVFTPIGASFLLNFGGQLLSAQSIPLSGTITIQNSEYETGKKIFVSDASIRAPFAKPETSGKTGQFTLDFSGMPSGTPVRITVSKPGLEVVNATELDQVILGRMPQLPVVMADPLVLAEAQVKYYRIATDGIARSYERRMADLLSSKRSVEERLADFTRTSTRQARDLHQAMELLKHDRDQAQERAAQLAQDFARRDLDAASDLVREAFGLFQRAQLDSALVILDQDRLMEEYGKARNARSQAEEAINQVYDGYGLRADILSNTFQLAAYDSVLDIMLGILDADPDLFTTRDRIALMERRISSKRDLGLYGQALEMARAHRAWCDDNVDPKDRANGRAWAFLGDALHVSGDCKGSLVALHRSRSVLEGSSDSARSDLADTYMKLQNAMLSCSAPDSALWAAEEAIRLKSSALGPEHVEVANAEMTRARILFFRGDAHKALEVAEGAYAILLAKHTPDNPDLANARLYLADIHSNLKRPDIALPLLEEAMRWDSIRLGTDHPEIAIHLASRGIARLAVGDTSGAELDFKRQWRIDSTLHGLHSPWLANAYNNLGAVKNRPGSLGLADSLFTLAIDHYRRYPVGYSGIIEPLNNRGVLRVKGGRYKDAMADLQEALATLDRTRAPTDYEWAVSYGWLGDAYYNLGQLDSALYCKQEALKIELLYSAPDSQAALSLYLWIGDIQCEMGDWNSASSTYEIIYSLRPKAGQAWKLFEIERNAGREHEAFDWLLVCARLRVALNVVTPQVLRATLDELRAWATRLDRKDILLEFGL